MIAFPIRPVISLSTKPASSNFLTVSGLNPLAFSNDCLVIGKSDSVLKSSNKVTPSSGVYTPL